MDKEKGPQKSTHDAVCFYCGQPGDLRPYGPKGSMVCFPCGTSDPERAKETGDNFIAGLMAAFEHGNIVVMDADTGMLYPVTVDPDDGKPGKEK